MKRMDYPEKLTIRWLKEKYQQQEITPTEVISVILERATKDIEKNIWITPPSRELIEPYITRLNQLNKETAPLWGIPFAIKDNIDLANVETTAGCPDFTYVPTEDAVVVRKLIEAGAIPIGKTNLDQFATGLVGTRSPYGETHNALRNELISGGSSAGSAVAVARGQAAFALGTDTAGSGRVPAGLNHLVGFKPSLGAWSTKGVVPACASLDCVTVFTHTIEDALIVDDIARGTSDVDPWSREINRSSSTLPEKICLPNEPLYFFGPYASEYEKAWNKTVNHLEQLNLSIEYIDTSFFKEAAAILYDGPWVSERWADLGAFIEANPNKTFPVTEEIVRKGASKEYDAASVFRASHKLQQYKLAAKKLLSNSVLILPTCGGTWTREQVRKDPIGTNSDMGLYTNHCNLLDLCAIAIPSIEIGDDLPFGITLFSEATNEGFIFGLAQLISGEELEDLSQSKIEPTTFVAVCGLHMRGFPLEKQMLENQARFVCEAVTAPKYKMLKLASTPLKPGLVKQIDGSAIKLELWEMPLARFGSFVASIPSPLGIGKVELEDGSEVPGFICEQYAAETAEDITHLGGWRYV